MDDVSNLLYTQWNQDSNGNKINIQITNEQHQVVNGTILLSQIPNEFNHVIIDNYFEISKTQTITSANQFSVNYVTGNVNFYSTEESKNITVTNYFGRGQIYIDKSRIVTENDGSTIVETLDQAISIVHQEATNYGNAVALSAANATLEMIESRKGETTLGTKIGKMDTLTALKADKTYVDSQDILLSNKIGILTDNGITEASLALAVKNDRAQLAAKAPQSELNISNTNIINNAIAIANNSAAIALKSDKTYVDTLNASAVSGSPKDAFATLATLQSAYPTGATGIYLVVADGKWYYYNAGWIAGGTYQSTGIPDYGLTLKNMGFPVLAGNASINLFNKDTAINGFFVLASTGVISGSAPTYAYSDYIPVLPSTAYILQGTGEQLAFYNSGKVFASGIATPNFTTFTTPSTATFVRLSMKITEIPTVQLEKNTISQLYESFYPKFDESIIKYFISYLKLDPLLLRGTPSKNLFNLATITSGKYITFTNGNLTTLANYNASDFIPILPSTQYILTGTTEQFAFYNSSKVYASGLATSNNAVFTSPVGAYYIRLSVKNAELATAQLEQNSIATYYESFGYKVVNSILSQSNMNYIRNNIGLTNIIKTVKLNGTGDFTSLRSALESILDSTVNKSYEVQISEGTYDILAYYTTTEINDVNFVGLKVPDWVHLKGIGDKNKLILKGELADSFSTDTKYRVSTLNLTNNGNLENLIVTGKNTRYAVHDDYLNSDLVRKVKNCNFIKYLGSGYAQAWGEGNVSGTDHTFEDSYFFTEFNDMPYSFHNKPALARASKHKFINCRYENINGLTAIRFGSMGSGNKDTISMIGCRLKGQIKMFEEVAGSGAGCDFTLSGYGNDVVPVEIITTDGKQYAYDFAGETKKMYNGDSTIITKGTPVQFLSEGSAIGAFSTGTDLIFYFGIAIENIAIGGSGMIRTGGYLRTADTNLTGLVLGNKIGIVNGVLVKVTTGDYIGIVTLTNYIKLK